MLVISMKDLTKKSMLSLVKSKYNEDKQTEVLLLTNKKRIINKYLNKYNAALLESKKMKNKWRYLIENCMLLVNNGIVK